MIVVCINNGICNGATSKSVNLTIGKKYKILYTSNNKEYQIVNDLGNTCSYHKSRFVLVKDWRQKQLDKLINA